MTRHGRNATASTVYSYHEKKKDTKSSGYGTESARLGKDSIKEFDCCSLTLQPCRDPVITKEGHLYEKEAILECLLRQKQENAKKLKAYEKQKKKLQLEESELSQTGEKAKVKKFLETEGSITTKRDTPFKSLSTDRVADKDGAVAGSSKETETSSVSNMADEKKKSLPSFWIPSLTPDAKPDILKKPDGKTYCPMSGKQLKVKDLIAVKFTPVPDDDKRSIITKEVRYKCPVTHDLLGNSVPCAVLKPSGHVVTMECVEKFIKKDWICPLTGVQLKESDIIQLQRGGTGFSGTGIKLEAKRDRPVMMIS